MMKKFISNNATHICAIILFLIISAICSKPTFEGKKLNTHDINSYLGVTHQNTQYEKENDIVVLWNNNLFSGMPSFPVTIAKQENVFNSIYKFLHFNHFFPFAFIFWYLLGFYIMLCCFKINPWISLVGSLALAFSSYYFIIIAAGHLTKAISIGYIGPIIGGVYLAFDRNKLLKGAFIMTFFFALLILCNHIQVIYYTGIIIFLFGIFEFVDAIRKKKVLSFFKTVGVLALGLSFALAINAASLLTINEYVDYSIRGRSELTHNEDNTSGLDKSYATTWSYGIDETFTLLIPNAKGGASYQALGKDSHIYNSIVEGLRHYPPAEVNKFAANVSEQVPTYFGDQMFTSGPVYIGAFVIFLFVLGLLIVPGKIKWWLLTASIVSIVLSWGGNFDFLTSFLLEYLPAYNKFRTMSMILIIAEITIPLLAILALVELYKGKLEKSKLINKFYIALGVTGLMVMLFIVYPSVFGLTGESKSELAMATEISSYIPDAPDDFKYNIANAIVLDRADLVRKDAKRSLLFIILGGGIVFFLIKYDKSKYKKFALFAIAILFLLDLWPINNRYLNETNYLPKRRVDVPFVKSKTDEIILQDKHPSYRVCNLQSTFSDAATSYYHKSIGGYSAAKIRRYQDLADSIMGNEIQMSKYIIETGYKNGFSSEEVESLFNSQSRTPILNMLNAKYLILNHSLPPIVNNSALGNSWFVENYSFVKDASEELNNLSFIDPSKQAVIDRRFENQLNGVDIRFDANARIELVRCSPDSVVYESSSSTSQLALFSEIYYPKGWKVTIDGSPADYFRANYVLRAMVVPEGKHIIEFSFEPKSYTIGVIISYISTSIFFILLLVYLYYMYCPASYNLLKRKKTDN